MPSRALAWVLFLVWGAGCSDSPRAGAAGESCTAASDCGAGLACIGQVCVASADAGPNESTQLGVGSRCDARRQCMSGLMCVDNVCRAAALGTDPGSRYSGLGESCQATNDCEGDLACVSGTCRQQQLSLPRTEKSCHRVECATADDCCASFQPNPNCDTYKMNCDTDPVFCNTYRSLCECNQECVDEQCTAAAQGCMSNAECTSQQTPYCVDGRCRQCDGANACTQGAQCVDGVCMAPCTIDENCPLLHACHDGVCERVGCQSDRECAFLTKNPLGVCLDGACQVPCSADSDCTTDQDTAGFSVCDQGRCQFVGCENNAECRALLNIQNQPGNVQAICR